MPEYKNNNSGDVIIAGERVGGGETLKTPLFLSSLPAGVVKISDEPFYHPIVLSTTESGDTGGTVVVDIPQSVNGVEVKGVKGTISCTAGSAEIRFNVDSAEPPLILNVGDNYQVGVRERLIDKIHIKFTSVGSSVTINLERS